MHPADRNSGDAGRPHFYPPNFQNFSPKPRAIGTILTLQTVFCYNTYKTLYPKDVISCNPKPTV